MLAYNGPYGLGAAMREPVRNSHAAYYANHELPSMPRDTPHPWNHNHTAWLNDVNVRRKYAAEISGIDDGVGRIVDTLRRNSLDRNTLVVFVADQGLAGGHSGFWGMGDHTRPLTAYDWTTWIPLIVRHPGRVAAGQRSGLLVSTYDVMPSIVSYLGLESRLPRQPTLPGRNFAPALEGRTVRWDDTVFFEFENVRSIRTPDWKYIERFKQEPNELYHLKSDAGERLNLAGNPAHRAVRENLRARLHAFFDRYADPKWDLWKGGRSKVNAIAAGILGLENPYRRP
jgi:arylsulfatase A-like enzyme